MEVDGLPINVDGGARRENLFSTLRDSKLDVVNGEWNPKR